MEPQKDGFFRVQVDPFIQPPGTAATYPCPAKDWEAASLSFQGSGAGWVSRSQRASVLLMRIRPCGVLCLNPGV